MMSVPPEIDCTGTGPTASATQSYCQSCRTAPVESAAQPGEVGDVRRPVAGVLAQLQIGRAGAEDRDSVVGDELPEALRARDRPVVEHDVRADRQGRQLPVPHHPGGRRVEVQRVVRAEVTVEAVLLDVLQQGPAGAVHHRLGRSGGAGGEHDEQRGVEGTTLPARRTRRRPLAELGQPIGRQVAVRRGLVVEHEHRAQGGQPGEEGRSRVRGHAGAVEHQEHRLDLLEAAEQGGGTHVGRGRGHRRTDGRAGERGDHRRRRVGRDEDHPLAGAQARSVSAAAVRCTSTRSSARVYRSAGRSTCTEVSAGRSSATPGSGRSSTSA
jgi:hypothetical protein